MAKHGGMYDKTPSIKHEEGKAKVVKPSKKDKSGGETDEGVKDEGFPVHVRHAMDRHHLHAKHETEHAMHDGKGGDKKEMHARHEKEHKDMHTRHEKEAGAHGGEMAGAGGATKEPVEKVEKGAKS